MNDFEKFIRQQSDNLNDAEPATGHFRRFEEKLHAYNQTSQNTTTSKKTLRYFFTGLLKVAAVAVLLIMSSLYVYDRITGNNGDSPQQRLTLGDISEEYREVEFYYTSLYNEGFEQLSRMPVDNNVEKEMLLEEIREMDIMYNNLVDDLNANPGDERVINSLITHYRMKVEILNKIIDKLNNVKPVKNNDHEKVEV